MGFPRDVLVQIVLSRDQAHVAFTPECPLSSHKEDHAVGFPRDVLVQIILSRDQHTWPSPVRGWPHPSMEPCPSRSWLGRCMWPSPLLPRVSASMSGKGGPGTLVPSSTRGSSGQDLRGLGSGPRWVLDVLLGRAGLELKSVILTLGKGR